MATVSTVTHPAGSSGRNMQSGIGTAPVFYIGSKTGTKYTLSSNAISSVDTRDLLALIHAGWDAGTIGTLTHPAGQSNTGPQAGIGTAPAFVIGQRTGTKYTVSSNAVSNIDCVDAMPLLHEGWV